MTADRKNLVLSTTGRIIAALIMLAVITFAAPGQATDKRKRADTLFAEAQSLTAVNRVDTIEAALPKFIEAGSIYRELGSAEQLHTILSSHGNSLSRVGDYYVNVKEYSKAFDFYDLALPILREIKDRATEASVLHNLGYMAAEEKSPALAAMYYQQAILAYRDAKNSKGELDGLRNLGILYQNQAKHQEAAAQYAAAVKLAVEMKEGKDEAELTMLLGDAFYNSTTFEKAEFHYKYAVNVGRRLGDAEIEAEALLKLGNTDLARYRIEAAIAYFEQSSAIYRRLKNTSADLFARLRIARSYLVANNNEKGEKALLELLDIAREQKDELREAEILLQLAFANRSLRRLETAWGFCDKALAKYRSLKDRTGEANVLVAAGDLLLELDRYTEAMERSKAAQKIFIEIGDRYGEASAYRSLGWIYYAQSKFSDAIAANARSLELTHSLGDPYGETEALVNFASVYSALGQFEKSLEHDEKALVLAKKYGAKYSEGIITNNIGYLYFRHQKYDKAREYLERATKILRELKYRHEEAYAMHNLGLVHYKLGNHQEALDLYDRALVIYSEMKARRPESYLYDSYGEIYRDLGQYEKAAMNLEKSLVLSREIKYVEVEAYALGNLMELWKRRSQPKLAVFYGKQAVNMLQAIRSTNRGLDKESQKSLVQSNEKTYRRLADLLVEQGRLPEAQQVLDLLKEEEFYEFVRRDAAEAADQAKLALNETERKALEQYNLVSGQLTTLGARFQELTEKRTKSDGKLPEPEEAEFARLKKQIEDAGVGLKAFLGSLSAEFSKKVEDGAVVTTQSIETMRADLRRSGKDVVLVSTYLLPERYRAIVTTGRTMVDRKVEYKDLKLSGADINKKIAEFKQALQNPRVDPRPLGKELYDIFVKPLEGDLRGAGAKTILWSLDGSLRYIPIAALSPDGKTYMAEHYQNVIVTLARQTNLFAKPTNDAWRAVGAGVSKEHAGFSALPSVTTEINSIVNDEADTKTAAGVLGGRKLLDEAFNLNKFRTTLSQQTEEGKPFNVVHLATHFSLGATNQDSALLLGDGKRLSLYEIGKDEELDFKDVELLTLSACETGVSTGEANGREVESLGMLAQQKGAKAVLATLWKVADESTSIFMSEFYRLKKETPAMAKSEALRLAQIAMIQGRVKSSGNASRCRAETFSVGSGPKDFKCDANAPFSHPYFWSPFVLIGNWR